MFAHASGDSHHHHNSSLVLASTFFVTDTMFTIVREVYLVYVIVCINDIRDICENVYPMFNVF